MNSVNLVGRMVYEPELKTTQSGTNYLPLRLAVSRNDKDKTTDFFSAKAWGKTAEFISKYFHKGDPIAVTGKLQVDSYEKQDGTKVSEVYSFSCLTRDFAKFGRSLCQRIYKKETRFCVAPFGFCSRSYGLPSFSPIPCKQERSRANKANRLLHGFLSFSRQSVFRFRSANFFCESLRIFWNMLCSACCSHWI